MELQIILDGGDGHDQLHGGDGNDWLYGSYGLDMLSGGGGSDHFQPGLDGVADIVTDYSHTDGDTVTGHHFAVSGSNTFVYAPDNTLLFVLANYDADAQDIQLIPA